jgi:hypothetical protein
MQLGLQAIPPVGVLFDSDLGNHIDDVLALALLYGLDGKNECRVVATTVSKPNLKAAALSEVVGRFYAGDVSTAFNAVGRTLPVGLADTGAGKEDTPMMGILEKKTAEGKLAYNHAVATFKDTAHPVDVLRNAISAQHPHNAVVVVTGPATNIADLLDHQLAKPFITERVRHLIFAGGAFPDGAADAGIKANIAAAKKMFAEWPNSIIAVGSEVGTAIPFPGASIDSAFAWSPSHPVVDAYKAFQPMPYDAPATAMAAVLYAARAKANLFQLSEPGTIAVLDDGRTKFTPAANGKHRYLIVDPAQKEAIQKAYVDLTSAKPVPRLPRRRPQQQQQEQQQQQQQPPAITPPKPAVD